MSLFVQIAVKTNCALHWLGNFLPLNWQFFFHEISNERREEKRREEKRREEKRREEKRREEKRREEKRREKRREKRTDRGSPRIFAINCSKPRTIKAIMWRILYWFCRIYVRIHIIPRLYDPLRARFYQPTADFPSTWSQTDERLTSEWRDQHVESQDHC